MTSGPAVLCEALGGPCDGRMWVLPERSSIWLLYAGAHHLYRPLGRGRHGAAYRYTGISQPVGNNRRHGVPDLGAGDRLSRP